MPSKIIGSNKFEGHNILQFDQKMQKEPLVISNKSCKAYFMVDNIKVYFTGNFDSGNLEKVQQLATYTYRITPGLDKTRQSTRKNFFHFKTQGFKNCTVKFIVTRVYLLEQFIRQNQYSEVYHPVARRHNHGNYEKIRQEVKVYYTSQDQPELSFNFNFQQQNWVEFALTYPYSYEDNETLLSSIAHFKKNNDIYYHDEVLCRTSEHRKVHLLTITDRRNISNQRQLPVQGIFQEGERPFKINKPRVIISARVHPGETPASHCMEGVIRFLLNQKDYRSYLLRKHFHFILIPMLNPQGVFQGMFRNDLNGQNLNRMYVHCQKKKHKSIYSLKTYLQSLDRVDFFFDLHAHPSRKGFFIYGNAFDQFLQQTQAQIFSKMIEYNCPYFQNLDCIYSQKAMVAKDKHDNFTKQGCSRVYYFKRFKMIHSFTVECGYFAPTKLNPYPPQRQFTIPGSEYICTNQWQKFSLNQYTPQCYMMLGKSLLISIMDLFHINPYTRISTSDFKSINSLRKFTAQRVYNEVERFRLVDSNCYRKIKQIAKLIEENYYIPRFKHYGLTISQNYGMKHRKKIFSLNPRLYKANSNKKFNQIKSEFDRQKESKRNESQHQIFQHQKSREIKQKYVAVPLKSMSQKQFGYEFAESFAKYNKSHQIQHKHKASKSQKVDYSKPLKSVESAIAIKQSIQSFYHKSSIKYQKAQKSQESSRFKKLESVIMAELLNCKIKKDTVDKRPSDVQVKMERLGSYLKKEGKGSTKLPSIHLEKIETIQDNLIYSMHK